MQFFDLSVQLGLNFIFAVTILIPLALTTLCLRLPLLNQGKIVRKQVPDSVQTTFLNNPQFQSDIYLSAFFEGNTISTRDYGNLSCPFEWSKYSCFHQGKASMAKAAKQVGFEYQVDYEPFLNRHRNTSFHFIGDSLSRQQYIAFACGLHSNHIMEYDIPWRDTWPCHNNFNCIKGGAHGGFPKSCFHLIQYGIKMCYAGDLNEMLTHFYPTWKNKEDFVILGKYRLSLDDIFVMNVGLHDSLEVRKNQLQSAREVIQEFSMRVIYRSMSPSHYNTWNGIYADGIEQNICRDDQFIEMDPMYAHEIATLQNSGLIFFFDIYNLSCTYPEFHVGLGINVADCVHWCMPGVVDFWNDILVTIALPD